MLGSERVTGGAVMIALGSLGTIGNLMVLVVFTARLVTGVETDFGNLAIVSLSVTGLFMSAFFSVTAAVTSLTRTYLDGLFSNKSYVSESMCYITGWIHAVCYISACLGITFMAIHRHLAILNPHNYKTILSKSRCVVAAGFIWAISGCWALTPVFGWGEYKSAPDWEIPLCTLGYSKSFTYVLVTAFVIPLLPMIITVLCFWKCLKSMRSPAAISSDVSVVSEDLGPEEIPSGSKQQTWRDTQRACFKADILIAVTFVALNVPLSIAVSVPTEFPTSFLYWTTILGSVHFATQWIFIAMHYDDFAVTKTRMITKICGRAQDIKNEIHPD